MKTKSTRIIAAVVALLIICSALTGSYFLGRKSGQKQASDEQERLSMLNRASIENMIAEDGTIYVIGHRSPDSDTVCSAIAYARLLGMLGFDAQPAVTQEISNETAMILREAGVEVPQVLTDAADKNIFLVDHSEYAQAAQGMENAHIVGVIDHHGVGSVSTGHQVVYEARPIGATATIIWLDYLNYGLEIDKSTAYILLGAILSDTNTLTGTTTTEADRQAVETLAKLAGVEDFNALGYAIHVESLSYEGLTDEEIFFSDYKEYEVNGVKFGIGIVNAIDEETAQALAERMKNVMPSAFTKREVNMMFASVGIRENGEKIDRIVPVDDNSKEIFEKAFPNYDEYNGTAFVFRTGLGRKTLFVPGMTDYLNSLDK